ncbi:MAG TPA: type II secretion system protein [Xanthomonadaceae bacterium]|nr:type II secretion system protein [Xanthomonadaceae bacterium]
MSARARQRGFSLVELAVALAILGLVAVVLVKFLGASAERRREVVGRDLLTRADDALLAFAMVHSRLPCPASDTGGDEDCAGAQVGRLPWRTLGLPDARARLVRYGVQRRPSADPRADADLAVAKDRFRPLVVVAGLTATEYPLGVVNGLDLCWALRSARLAAPDAGFLHVTRPQAPTSLDANVAYALALPRGTDGFTGRQATSAPSFDSPRRLSDSAFHDRVVAVGADQLWGRMRCGDHLSGAGHAHFNAAVASAVMQQSLIDYKKQLEIAQQLADANVDSGAAAILSGTAAVAGAGGGIADTVSEGLASTGAVSYRVALAAAATAAAAAVLVTATAMTVVAADAKEAADDAVDDSQTHIDRANTLQPLIRADAEAADAAGMY